MKPTGEDVEGLIAQSAPAVRRRDAETLVTLMQDLTGREPVAWGTIIGFGSCHYKYPTGNEGDMPLLAFAPRKAATTIYLESTEAYAQELARLGAHTASVGCLYIKDLEKIDLDVLRDILMKSLAWSEAGGNDYAQISVTG